jgi:hypothetical protein
MACFKKSAFLLTNDDINTRGKRRRMVKLIRDAIDTIHFAEGMYMAKIPENLRGGPYYDAALSCLDLLEDAIVALDEAYDN